MQEMKEKKWYAVYTKPRWEKKVASLLSAQHIVNYCPLNKIKKRWSDRIKTVLVPLFPSYVFVQIGIDKVPVIRDIPGVVNFLHLEGRPAIVKDYEVERIQRFLSEFEQVELESLLPQKNQRVTVNQGLLVEEEGRVIDLKNNKVAVTIDSLEYKLTAVFDKSKLITN